ncbi:MAG: ABC transporter permease [Rhodothermaceae bacterium]
MINKEIRYAVLGDFEELFEKKYSSQGYVKAVLWLWLQVVKSSPNFITDKIYWGVVMFRNYFKISYRNMIRHKTYSIINILGLAIGMAACIIIGTYLLSEISFDKFHKNYDRIYRVTTFLDFGSNPVHLASSNYPAAAELKERYPEVVDAVRFRKVHQNVLIENSDKHISQSGFVYADQSVFNIFSFPLLKGDPETALKDPYSIVLTEDIAEKMFGDKDPLGKFITVNESSKFKITGIVKNPPFHSHIKFSMLASFVTLKDIVGDLYEKWLIDFQNFTYLLLQDNNSEDLLQTKLPDLVEEKIGKLLNHVSARLELKLEPLSEIYLNSSYVSQFSITGNIDYIYIFSAIALLILLIACVNFMNLSTARSITRTLEIGLRKVHGANKSQLIFQFVGESFLYSILSLLLACLLLPILWPIVFEFSGLNFSMLLDNLTDKILIGLSLVVFVGIMAGLYPAIYLSGKKLTDSLQSKTGDHKSKQFRKILVITQFVISIGLIGSTGIIKDQLEFVNSKNLGFQKENILVVPVENETLRNNATSIKAELLKYPDILSVATSQAVPGAGGYRENVFQPEDRTIKESVRCAANNIDIDFIKTLKLEIVEGRNFSTELPSDKSSSIIVNETLVKKLGWENPVGKTITELDDRQIEKTIIGVVKDYHFHPLTQEILPLIIENEESKTKAYIINVSMTNFSETLKTIENILKDKTSKKEFDYYFLDEVFNNHFSSVQKIDQMFSYFTFLAIFLTCIGLLGLATFTAEQRTKEIGIRKSIGASVSSIAILLTKEFFKWILIGNIIAWPIIWFVMSSWLEGFPYRTEISILTLIIAGVLTTVVSLITISFITVKSAKSNPVDSLKYE